MAKPILSAIQQVVNMRPETAVKKLLNSDAVYVSSIKPYIKVIIDDNKMLKKDNERLRQKIKKLRGARL